MSDLERSRSRPSGRQGFACALLAALIAGSTQAASLQVAPTSLQLTARQNAEALWISNSGTAPVDVQARVFRWTQRDGRDELEPTTDLVISPPMQALAAGQQQLIRVVRADPQPPAGQQAYRVIVDEVPTLDPNRQGMQFVLRYSLPVFVQPEDKAPETPELQATLLTQPDGTLALEVRNLGASYAQLADLAMGTPERPQVFKPLECLCQCRNVAGRHSPHDEAGRGHVLEPFVLAVVNALVNRLPNVIFMRLRRLPDAHVHHQAGIVRRLRVLIQRPAQRNRFFHARGGLQFARGGGRRSGVTALRYRRRLHRACHAHTG